MSRDEPFLPEPRWWWVGTARAVALPRRLPRVGRSLPAGVRSPQPRTGMQGPPGGEPLDGLGAALCSQAAGPARPSGTTRAGVGVGGVGVGGVLALEASDPRTAGWAPDLAQGPPPPSATARSGARGGRRGGGRCPRLAERTSCSPSLPLASSRTLRPPPVPVCGDVCLQGVVGWRISWGSASRAGGPGRSILSSDELFVSPLTRWGTGSSPNGTIQQGPGLVPRVYAVGLRVRSPPPPPPCGDILTPPAGLPSHRWGRPHRSHHSEVPFHRWAN